MENPNVLTTWEVRELVYVWFRKITIKAPVEELLDLLSPQNLEMNFPDDPLKNYDDFKKWYEKATHTFFDQIHEVKMLDIAIAGNKAKVNLIVNWQATTWEAPAPVSKWVGFDVFQNWEVKKDDNGKAVIVKYNVGKFEPMMHKEKD